MRANRYFRVVTRKDGLFRLTHIPSGDYVQRHLVDFTTRTAAIACRDRMIAASAGWDWGDKGLFTNMPTPIDQDVWAAIYSDLLPEPHHNRD